MSGPASVPWHGERDSFVRLARNVATRYAGVAINALLGLLVLPINLAYLGPAAYGLWMLTASITIYFSVFDLGYGGTMVRFVAEYRARKDARGLNEVVSTMFYLYAGLAVACYAAALGAAWLLPVLFELAPDQVATGRTVLLIVTANVALHFIFGVYGGVVNGFQSYYLNNVVGIASNALVALVNVIVVMSGFGLVPLVLATTLVRMAPYVLYRYNAYKVFPALQIRWSHVRRERLRELTGFSVYMAVIDWSTRLNYTIDTLVIGAFLNTTAVAVFAIGQRLAEALFRMTHQLHVFLFPVVVHRSVAGTLEEQQRLLVRATRFQTAAAVAACGTVAAMGDRLIEAWVGRGYEGSVVILQLLAYVVVLRAWMAMPGTLLKGIGRHRFVAATSSVCAVANLLLSIALVKAMGLVGVALGTVIPVTVVATCAIFPAACRAVGLSTAQGYRRVLWPALWPAVVVIGVLAYTRDAVPPRLLPVLLHIAVGCLVYAGLFLARGLDREERQWFTARVTELWKRRSQVLAAA